MKKTVIAICALGLVLAGLFLYFSPAGFFGDKTITKESEMTKALNEYETIITKYEKNGLKTQEDILQFTSDIQSWLTVTWAPAVSKGTPEEYKILAPRLIDLQRRQKMMIGV